MLYDPEVESHHPVSPHGSDVEANQCRHVWGPGQPIIDNLGRTIYVAYRCRNCGKTENRRS